MTNVKNINTIIDEIMNAIDDTLCASCDNDVDCASCYTYDDTFRSIMFDVSTRIHDAHNAHNDDDEIDDTFINMKLSTM